MSSSIIIFHRMIHRIQTVLQTEGQLDPGQAILVGVSGGPDSVCLLDVLHRLGYRLVVAHFNHQLRETAAAEAQAVRRRADAYGWPAVVGVGDVNAFARAESLSLEEAARTLRYRFLFATAQQLGAQAVAVGHTADDQVETVLMHLLRGAGLAGLRGMSYRSLPNPWSQSLSLVRPLLSSWRAEVLAYVERGGLDPVLDPSNQDAAFFRNRLRHELIPFLEGYNPQVRASLWRMAQVLEGDHTLLMEFVETAWMACGVEEGRGYIAFERQPLIKLPVGLQRQLLRKAISRLRPGLRDVDFEAVERGLARLSPPRPGGRAELVAGLQLLIEGERVYVISAETNLPAGAWPQVVAGAVLSLEAPGSVHLGAGWILRAEIAEPPVDFRDAAGAGQDSYQAWIPAGELKAPLLVRARRPGDRFQPFGMDGRSQKISDFMINAKMPARARAGWPLVLAGETIAWVPGYRLAHPFRLAPSARLAVRLSLRSSPE